MGKHKAIGSLDRAEREIRERCLVKAGASIRRARAAVEVLSLDADDLLRQLEYMAQLHNAGQMVDLGRSLGYLIRNVAEIVEEEDRKPTTLADLFTAEELEAEERPAIVHLDMESPEDRLRWAVELIQGVIDA